MDRILFPCDMMIECIAYWEDYAERDNKLVMLKKNYEYGIITEIISYLAVQEGNK